MSGITGRWVADAHRHLGVLPPYPFYGGPPVDPAPTARATIAELIADMDKEGTERALVIPNYGVPDPDIAFSFNDLVVEAAAHDDRIRAALWVSAKASDADRTARALALAGQPGVRALKLSFLLGGKVADPDGRPQLDAIFAAAREHDLVVHIHTSPGAASDIDEIGGLVDRYGDTAAIHLVHFGGGMSGHIKLIGGWFFDWIAAGKRVYTDLSWSIGFAPGWLAAEIDRRGIGHDRVLFASDQPWGDYAGEYDELVEGAERLIRRGVYPFVVPFRAMAGTLAVREGARAPDPALVRDITWRVAALLRAAGMTGADQQAGCAACGACSVLQRAGG